MESQIVSPFTVPPPKPTETEKIQKDYFESTMKVKDGFLKMNQLLIIDKDQKILDLENMVIDLSNKLKKIEKENKDLVKKVKKHEKQWETAHDECNKDYRDLEDDVNNYADENESLKQELYQCKFKEKHIEGSRNKNKKKDYDEKCVRLEIENLKSSK